MKKPGGRPGFFISLTYGYQCVKWRLRKVDGAADGSEGVAGVGKPQILRLRISR
jgi:hypothetical protein